MGRDATNVVGEGSSPSGGTSLSRGRAPAWRLSTLPSGTSLVSKAGQQGSIPWWRAAPLAQRAVSNFAATSGEGARLITVPVRVRFPPLLRTIASSGRGPWQMSSKWQDIASRLSHLDRFAGPMKDGYQNTSMIPVRARSSARLIALRAARGRISRCSSVVRARGRGPRGRRCDSGYLDHPRATAVFVTRRRSSVVEHGQTPFVIFCPRSRRADDEWLPYPGRGRRFESGRLLHMLFPPVAQ